MMAILVQGIGATTDAGMFRFHAAMVTGVQEILAYRAIASASPLTAMTGMHVRGIFVIMAHAGTPR